MHTNSSQSSIEQVKKSELNFLHTNESQSSLVSTAILRRQQSEPGTISIEQSEEELVNLQTERNPIKKGNKKVGSTRTKLIKEKSSITIGEDKNTRAELPAVLSRIKETAAD